MVTRHDLVLEVSATRDLLVRFGQTSMPLPEEDRERMVAVVAEGYPRVPTMLTADRPTTPGTAGSSRRRSRPKEIAELEPASAPSRRTLIDSWIDRGRSSSCTDFAVPLPVEVIATR